MSSNNYGTKQASWALWTCATYLGLDGKQSDQSERE